MFTSHETYITQKSDETSNQVKVKKITYNTQKICNTIQYVILCQTLKICIFMIRKHQNRVLEILILQEFYQTKMSMYKQ